MGGGSKQDGLSLWPLQWILSEATRYGLIVEFQVPERLVEGIQDPMEYTMPRDKGPHQIPFKNGATVQMWDLNEEFNRPDLQPGANEPSGLTAQLSTSERQISTDDDTAAATIIHPSVFWADDITPLGIKFLNPLTCANKIRQAIKDLNIRPESLYWNLHHTRLVNLERSRPRVLICGPSGVGKSTLVNEVLGDEVSLASSGIDSVQHEIDAELTSSTAGENGDNFIFHDANGFERGLEETLRRVHGFIKKRQETTTFEEQLHCIWYCCNSVARIEEADREFLRSTSSRGVPFIVVFTSRIPADFKTNVESRRDSILDSRCQERRNLVSELSTGQCEICFVTTRGAALFDKYVLGDILCPTPWKELIAQTACAILVCEKLFWLGIKEIRSREIVARALFEVLKQSQEIARFLEQVKTPKLRDLDKTVSNLVLAIRPNLGIVAE
ncbi:hypothetical protein CDV31_012003 [Fusarium ambrosium]|uniref:G domain-containing protein n=1 Tax=Fusarium ambrosium TaxID=131363 RepID=A0A428TCU6_9HYPO|nr:hypothetical protein CDV31_012003 [Fusarium ambrosium]